MKRKRKHRALLIALAVLVGLCLIGGNVAAVAEGANDSKPSGQKEAQPQTPKTSAASTQGKPQGTPNAAPGLGDAVRDGKFEFVVSGISCGHSEVGDTSLGLGETAQGQFCLAKMTVKNIGDEPQTFDDTAQLAFDKASKKYSANSLADLAISPNAWLADINPGNKLTGTVVFDIPESDKIVRLELHDSLFSGGVTVNNS